LKKILAIDDQKDNLVVIEALIKNYLKDCHVYAVQSGQEGIRAAIEEQPDVILLDIIMPRMDGYEVCKKLKENPITNSIPVIMLTAIKTDSDSRIKGLNLGADAFLSKPIDPLELAAQIKVMFRIKAAEELLKEQKLSLENAVKERTNALIETEKKFRSITEQMRDLIYFTNDNGNITYVSPASESVFGYKPEEMIGKPFTEFLYEPDIGKALEEFQKAIKTESKLSINTIELRMKHKDKSFFFGELRGQTYRFENMLGNIGVIRDISSRKKADKKLEMLSYIVKQSTEGIAIADLNGNMIFSNRAWCRMHEYEDPKDYAGMNLKIFHSGEQYENEVVPFNIKVKKHGTYSGEINHITKNGKSFPTLMTTTLLINPDGKPFAIAGIAKDITENKIIEDKLLKSEEKYRSLITNIPDVVWTSDIHGRTSYLSPNVKEVYGFSSAEIYQSSPKLFQERVHPDDKERLEIAYKNLFLKNNKFDIEYRIQKKNGEWVWLHDRSIKVYEKNGIQYADGLFADITKRKKTEGEMQKLVSVVKHSSELINLSTLDGKMIFLNKAGSKMLGIDPDNIEGVNIMEVIPEHHINLIENDLLPALLSGGTWEGELEYKNLKTNRLTTVYANTFTIKDPITKKIQFLANVSRDITESKKLEQELKKSESNLRTLFNAMTDLVMEIDYDGRFINIAPTSEKLLYRPIDEVLGKTLHEIFPRPDADNFLSFFRKCLDEKKSITIEYPLLINNKKAWFEGRATPKTINSVLYIAHDISERKMAEIAFKESQNRFKLIADVTTDLIYEWDVTTDSLKWFGDIDNLLGYESGEIEHTIEAWIKLIHPQDIKKLSNSVELHRTSTNPIKEIYRICKKDGSWIYWSDKGIPILDNENKPIKWIGGCEDITELKQAENIQKAFYNISNAVNTTYNLHDLIDKIRYFLSEVIDTTNLFVALYNKINNAISLEYHADRNDTFDEFPPGKTLTRYVIATGKPLFVSQKLQNQMIKQGLIENIGTQSQIWMGVPLKIKNEIIGIIVLQSYSDPYHYTENDIEILSFISDEIALAIEHKRANNKLLNNLEEKSSLLRELYHRTKNNMQVISGMLNIQSRLSNNEFIQTSFKEVINKINSMAMVHQKLYQAKDLSKINLKEYILDIVRMLIQSYLPTSKNVSFKLDLDDVFILIDSAIPLGLILNELISNPLKHAFPDGAKGVVYIKLHQTQDKMIFIEINDNGKGVKPGFNPRETQAIGLQTVFTLIEYQLKGDISYDFSKGVTWYFNFKDDLHTKRI